MKVSLVPHPDTPSAAITAIEVKILRVEPNWLALRYTVRGDITALVIPGSSGDFIPGEELWKHTCLEAFVKNGETGCYYEFNYSPSRRFAAYAFSSYRVRQNISLPPPGAAELWCHDNDFVLNVAQAIPDMNSSSATWALGLSGVMEEKDGRMSYWALNHSRGEPDFHHPESFSVAAPSWEPL